jgi:hypothetical protein
VVAAWREDLWMVRALQKDERDGAKSDTGTAGRLLSFCRQTYRLLELTADIEAASLERLAGPVFPMLSGVNR